MEVGHGERAMQCLGLNRWLVRGRVQGAIESAFDDAGQGKPRSKEDNHNQEKEPAKAFHFILSLRSKPPAIFPFSTTLSAPFVARSAAQASHPTTQNRA